MSEANKTIVRRLCEETINKAKFDLLDEVLSTEYLYREPTAGEKRGRSGFRELVTMYRTAFPDLKMTIEEQLAEGDRVVTRWTATGTHRGELMGIAPTGKQVHVQGIAVTRIANGKVVEVTEIYDVYGMLRQLGVLPGVLGKAA